MTLGLFPDENADALEEVQRQGPGTPEQAGIFTGIPTGIATGVVEGEAKLGEAFAGAAMFGLRKLQHAALTPGAAAEFSQQTGLDELDPDELDARVRANSQWLLDKVKPDPMTVGFAGQVLHGIASVGTRAVAGGVAGMGGAVATAAASEGYSTAQDFERQGVDKNTAKVLGAGSALMTGAGLGLPGMQGVGSTLATRVLSGAAVNTLFGAADRAAMHSVLADKGYDTMAAQYRVMDGQSLMTDAILGGVFGAQGYLHSKIAPSVVDAALAANEGIHVENDLSPGVAIDPTQRDLHVDNLVKTTEALLNGDDVPELTMPEVVPNPAQDALRKRSASETADAQAEALDAVGIVPERRQDAIDTYRMAELRAKGIGNLSVDEAKEFAQLLDADRLAAKVGGRRIHGLLSREALEERIAAGQGFSHYAYFDLDMFKDINDQFGMHHGDEAIRAAGEGAAELAGEGNAFKGSERAGDEFVIGGDSPEDLEAKIQALRKNLANHTIELYDKDGNLIKSRKGLDFSHGIGTSVDAAAAASKLAKTERARLGLRTDRGSVPEAVRGQDRQGGSEAPARAKALPEVKTPAQAISRLTASLKKLVASNGKDAVAHQDTRALMEHIVGAGWDQADITRAAVDRAGERAGAALQGALVRDQAPAETGGLDDATRESVERAQSVIEQRPDLAIPGDAGTATNAHAALNQALEGVRNAKQEGALAKVAAACLARA